MDKNIEKFNLLTGLLLEKLYSNFPIAINLENKQCLKEWGFSEEDDLFFSETFYWLASEGYINFRGPQRKIYFNASALANEYYVNFEEGELSTKDISLATRGWIDVALSMKSLLVLNSMPDNLKEKKSYGALLRSSVKDGLRSAIGDITSNIFTATIKSIGGVI